jgi:hypothetical protein
VAGDARQIAWTITNVVMLLMFVLSAIVQVNDPDPMTWIAIYAAAGAMCALEVARKLRPGFPGIVCVIALIWAGTIAPRVIGKVAFTEMFAEFEMKNVGVEESREMYGLLIVAAWMAAVTVAAWKRRPASLRSS